MQIAIVIPAFNEHRSIVNVATRALQQAKHVIIVDDGSSDQTLALLQDLQKTNNKLVVLANEQNMGKAATLWAGMQYAEKLNVDAVISLDGDGQHCPEDIPRFIETARQQPNTIIIGARLADKSAIPAKRYYANKFANFWLSWAAGYVIDDSQSGFRLYPSELIRQLTPDIQRAKSFVFESEILISAAKLGVRSIPIKIEAIYNADARPSHFRGVTDILLITRMVAWSLFSRGMYPMGLFNITVMHGLKGKHSHAIGADGIAMLLLSLLVILVTGSLSYFYFLHKTFSMAKNSLSYVSDTDILLLLGMRLKKNKVHTLYQQRLDKAAELLSSQPNLKVIILGGLTGNASITEAQAGKNYLINKNISAEHIITEHQSRHTLENLKLAKTLIDEMELTKIALLTNRFHLYRALTLARGFKLYAKPCAAENIFSYKPSSIIKILIEAFLNHWYSVGKAYAFTTKNKHMISRIS
ncbi:hypothetical protein MNBD_GAMMA23-2461 [hydrothermal vent metagenome]|uniref:Glycosyltransferase 2-like domain-containing protein n=1 Tax=hydrothermal vent metagenome TaxID=652676 RepID=A0A3B0ZXE4_9ZZZZ